MNGDLSRSIDERQDKALYDLESLKRELWMRVLGMKANTPHQVSSETTSMSATPITSNGPLTNQ